LARGNSGQRERTRERIKASNRVKLAEWIGLILRAQSDREAFPSGGVKSELIVDGESRLLRVSVGVAETGGDKARKVTVQHASG